MDAEILVDSLYANMNLKVDVTSHTLSSSIEQGYFEVSLIPKSLTAVPTKESSALAFLHSLMLPFLIEVL